MFKNKRRNSPLAAFVFILLGIGTVFGCGSTRCSLSKCQVEILPKHGSTLEGFRFTNRSICLHQCNREFPWPSQGSTCELSKRFLEMAQALSDADDPRSPDYYFQAAALSWQVLEEQSNDYEDRPCDWTTYQTSLAGLFTEATRFGRLDQRHLRIYEPGGMRDISIVSSGFPLTIDEFSELTIVNSYERGKLKHHYSSPGLGVPLVAIRKRPCVAGEHCVSKVEKFLPPCLPFAATLILGPRYANNDSSEPDREFVLELANPLQVNSIQVGKQKRAIARDITAPIEQLLELRPTNPLTAFVLPGAATEDEGLKWLEPYQPGKIPVVFVHGLLSDPSTWMDMVNDLRSQAWFNNKYQVWGFNYATGSPFVASALSLRVQLREARMMIDPLSQDAALDNMVLVGHSMGGLVAKLQVADSDDRIWNSISRVPLESIQASGEVKQELAQSLYFTSQPFISRVVYIATPHAGSSLAVRGIGRISSALIRPDEAQRSRHRQLIYDNPDLFFGTFRRRIPTSIDLLEPSDCTLQAIHGLRVPQHVAQHSIIGTGKWPWSLKQSDGVVSVDSADHPDSVSKLHVAAAHTDITRDAAAISEVARILHLHWDQAFVPRESKSELQLGAKQPTLVAGQKAESRAIGWDPVNP